MQDSTATVAQVLSPGENTSEHAQTVSTTIWMKLQGVLGVILTVAPQVVDLLSSSPAAQTKWGMQILSILGALITVSAAINHTSATNNYTQQRTAVKMAVGHAAATPPVL